VGDAPRAHFARAWKAIAGAGTAARPGFPPALAARYVKALRLTGHLDEARAADDEIQDAFPGRTDIVLEQALAASSGGEDDRAEELLRGCVEGSR
jgi:hypothetical protein